jgi:hypothetical protein
VRSRLREWGPVVLLALIPALPLLIGGGLVNTRAGGDSPFLLVRTEQLVQNLRAGIFPARWMPQAAYGLGYPFFNFYASLPLYLAAGLKLAGLGTIWSIKFTQSLGFVFAALAAYGLSKELHPQKRAANILVALAYSCAPFHMVNVYVRGDSLSEFYAFVFFPLILWGLSRLHKKPSVANAVWVGLSYAGLILTHNISALIFSPFVISYTLGLAWETKDVGGLVRSLLALAAGLLASAWFWLPALTERDLVYVKEVMTTGYFHYAQHFRGWDLIQCTPSFDYAITATQQPFRMGLVQAALTLMGCAAVVVRWIQQRRAQWRDAYWLILLAASTSMITPLSRPLWQSIPLLPLVQFPWRFLSLQAFAGSLLVAHLVPRPRQENTRQGTLRPALWIATALGLLVLGSALLQLHPERLLIDETDVTAERLMLYEYFTANIGTTIRADYLPSWVNPRPYTSEALWQGGDKPTPLTIAGQTASAAPMALGPTSERWAIDVTSPEALLAFHTYYYPGWEAFVDGQPAQIEPMPGLGYIGLRLPQGSHEVSLRLGRTRVQWIAEVVSALTMASLLAALGFARRRGQGLTAANAVSSETTARPGSELDSPDSCRSQARPSRAQQRLRVLPGLALIGPLLVLVLGGRPYSSAGSGRQVSSTTVSHRQDLTMDFDRMPYLHHNPDGVLFGEAARLAEYDLSAETVQAGEALVVSTFWDKAERDDLVVRVALVSPAQHLFAVPLAIAIDEEPLDDTQLRHVLQVPGRTARGMNLLAVRVYGAEGEIRPVNSRGETLGTTYLVPIRIENMLFASEDDALLAKFDDRIALSSATTVQGEAGRLDVALAWHVSAAPPQNYKVALRLRDASGREVARLDTQPGYGFYPTSMWRTGELVSDRYILFLDDGTPPGTDYHLDVTLYEAATLQPIGTTRVGGITLQLPTQRQDYAVLHRFGEGLVLSEAQAGQTELEQGAKLSLLLKWAAQERMSQDYECFVALSSVGGMQIDYPAQPLAREYPSSNWPTGAVVNQHVELQLAPDLPVGQYALTLNVLESSTGQQLGQFVLPQPVRIVETTRNFAIPEMQTVVGADFAELVRLLGYDLQREDETLRLRLHWQALSAMGTEYKVFVHLFDARTETIVAQQDILAGGPAYPTTRWVSDEVVSDEVELTLEDVPPDTYSLAIGLYHGDARLSVVAPPGFTVSADRLLLEQVQLP